MVGSQARAFLSYLGDQWLERNRDSLGQDDLAEYLLDEAPKEGVRFGKSVLELGCSNGWRLAKLKERGFDYVRGVEPSEKAVREANRKLGDDTARVGTADRIPFAGPFDLIISGFALSLCDPEDYPAIVAEIHRLLRPGGHLLIYEYFPDDVDQIEIWPICKPTVLDDSGDDLIIRVFAFDRLFLTFPGYIPICGIRKERRQAVLIQKESHADRH